MTALLVKSLLVLLTVLKVVLAFYVVTLVVIYLVGIIFSTIGIRVLGNNLKCFVINQIMRTLRALKLKG